MIIGGIDPGKKGGLSLYDVDGNALIGVYHVPVIKPKGKKERPNWAVLAAEWRDPLSLCDHVFIEQVGAMPKQGTASCFNFGYSAGFVYGLVFATSTPHAFLTPQKWQKLAGVTVADGRTSIVRACQLFPASAPWFKRVTVDEGVAEASLIAYAGHLTLNGASDGSGS